jgi:hypothetical protein
MRYRRVWRLENSGNHEIWDLEAPPDMVAFAKKFQVSGVFLRKEAVPVNVSPEFTCEATFDLFRLDNLAKIVEVLKGIICLKSRRRLVNTSKISLRR